MTAQVQADASWNKTKVIESLEFLWSQHEIVLEYFTELLNGYNGLNKSAGYYDLISGEWLLHFTHVLYAAYMDVAQNSSAPDLQNPIYVFADYNDFQQTTVNDPHYSNQLRQQVVRLVSGLPTKNFRFERQVCTLGQKPQSGIWQKFKSSLKSGLITTGSKNAPFIICDPSLKCNPLEWRITQLKWRKWARQDDFDFPIDLTCRVDVEWRLKNTSDTSAANFVDVVRALLPLYIPVIYLEAFVSYRQMSHALYLHRPKALYTANSLHGHTLFKTLVADWRNEGTKLLNHQHGGGYGIERIHPFEDYETRVADRFYTFGWESTNRKQVPLAGALSASQFDAADKSGPIKLVCICYPKQIHRIHLQPMAGKIKNMIAETADFVREMKGKQEILVRPYIHDYKWGMVETLRRADSDLKLDNLRNNSIKSYTRSSLVVHNYLGTSWLETLAMNIPTVCFYDNETYAFRDEAQPYLDALAAVGILHASGKTAARFIIGLKNNPQQWWQTPEVQDARSAFVHNYANYSSTWAAEWEAEFKQWIE